MALDICKPDVAGIKVGKRLVRISKVKFPKEPNHYVSLNHSAFDRQ